MARMYGEEFHCRESGGGCNKYFLTNLRDNMTGNYTVECPNCGHHHFRTIKNGVITEDRHSDYYSDRKSILLMGLKSTVRDVPYHNDPSFLRRQKLRLMT